MLLATCWEGYAQERMRPPSTKASFPSDKDVVEVPFVLQQNKIVIPIQVNGSRPLSFVLDTGAPTAVLLDSTLGASLDLTIMGEAQVVGAGQGAAPRTIPVAGNVTFEVGGITITNATMAVGLGNSGLGARGFDGVLGRSIFSNLVVDIDWGNHIIRLYDPGSYAYKGNGTTFPLTVMPNGFPYVQASVSLDGEQDIPVTLVIDTGASHAVSFEATSRDEVPVPDKAITTILGWGASGEVRGELARVERLQLGNYVLEDVLASFSDENAFRNVRRPSGSTFKRHGNLGAEVLKRFRSIFDIPNNRLILEPTDRVDDAFRFTTIGLRVRPWWIGAEEIEIADVFDRSPGKTADIQVGDRITALNGKPIKAMNEETVRGLLTQESGDNITLTLERKGKTLEKTVTTQRML